jgi:predicted cobalt transporter CbtA
MRFNLRIPLNKILITLLAVLIMIPICFGQTLPAEPAQSIPEWFRNNLVVLGLVLSEVLAFLPGKAKGIVKAVWTIIEILFKKKSTSNST